MKASSIYPLSKKTFEELTHTSGLHCVSIYLPLDKRGKEQNEHLAQAKLKALIKEARNSLRKHQLHEEDIKNYLKPVEELLERVSIWRNPADGLAIFLDRQGLRYYSLPIPFETKSYVADHFYLKPLLRLYEWEEHYYILELSQDYVKLYQATRYGYEDLFVEDFSPDQLEKVVGFDFRPKMLQFRTGHATYGSSYHGHGEGKDDKDEEIFTFLRAVDKGVKKVIGNKNVPLVVAAVDSLFDMYKEASLYPNICGKNSSGDPQFKDKSKLHKESWELVADYFTIDKRDKLHRFTELYTTPKTSYEISDIVVAAMHGKIDTLFVQKGAELYGTYDKKTTQVLVDPQNEIQNTSLINLCSVQTFIQGGKVYFLETEEMPVKNRPMNALLRY